MLNPAYQFGKLRDVLGEFEPSRELSLAKTKLEECELWLTKCRPTREAVERDMVEPVSGPRPVIDNDTSDPAAPPWRWRRLRGQEE